MSASRRVLAWRVAVLVALAVLGIGAAVYVLAKQRAGNPFADTYRVNAELTDAGGVAANLNQPVNVAGVQVGSIVDTAVAANGNARVTLEIDRTQLPRVYGNATVSLEPITPLKDLRVELEPGGPPSKPLAAGGTLAAANTRSPVSLDQLLASLDTDARTYLGSLIAALDTGTRGEGEAMRRMLRALGPTTVQAGQVSRALARRRKSLARLVHDVAVVTRAASRDEELASLVQASNSTLAALAENDVPLRKALAQLPRTLRTADAALGHAADFSDRAGPAVEALLPAVGGLPGTLRELEPFADDATRALERDVRPFVHGARPLVRDLGSATPQLTKSMPRVTSAVQVLNYALNEFAHNPAGDDEGFLYWLSWFAHNWNSILSTADAHGKLGRTMVSVSCAQADTAVLREIDFLVKALVAAPISACAGD